MTFRRSLSLRLWGVGAACALGSSALASPLYDYNLVVLGDLFSTSEVDGTAFIGGNLSGPASNYATKLVPSGDWLGITTLSVGGNIASTINLQAGNLALGGMNNGTVNFNGGGRMIIDPTLGTQTGALAAQLQQTSSVLSGLTANSTVTGPGGSPSPVVFQAAPAGPQNLAVFSIDGNAIFSNPNTQQIELALNGADAIVINVSGTDIVFNSGNFVGSWLTPDVRARAIWNFYEAETITLDRNFNGAILAPLAHLTNSTDIDGSVFVGSFDQLGEVHLPMYTGIVPAPAGLALLGIASLTRRRRREA